MLRSGFGVAVLLLVLLQCQSAAAQSSRKWHFPGTAYFWLSGLQGTIVTAEDELPFDLTFRDVWRNLSWGMSAHGEAQKKSLAIFGDISYRNLRPSKDEFVADTDLLIAEVGAGYKVVEWFDPVWWIEAIGGARYSKISISLLENAVNVGDRKAAFTDPFLGGRFSWEFARTWAYWLRADVGGFGVGSDFSWNATTGFGYQVGSLTFLAAYRIWSSDYETGSGADYFKWDVTVSGLALGITFQLR